ncbi:lysophospholipase [Chitinophagaceae bacterium LB-8]|uniref:Lysophospholipase n=1 Tax=Paraflavisolibacter caeni TaxID=2982496 RepID=A0A9X2XS05_9BACT|nr:alpha/beta fold hydrolase [Paraflavisolibacter caeni]MCU7547530.1 lysophospholipase [Paraflavisolibacter caeni]
MNNMLFKFIIIPLLFYIVLCGVLFLIQERLIFFPEKLPMDYTFHFDQPFEEIRIKTEDQKLLHGILFQADTSKGLIFYLHGNAGSLRSWGEVAKTYTELNYDVFILDYRGYGKSEGSITSQKKLHQDVLIAYNEMKKRYPEGKIIVLGYSIGTGMASKLASTNYPRLLILQAPFYSLADMMKHYYPIIPGFILKYKLETNKYIKECKMPIVLIHGKQDEIIYYNSSVKLRELIKTTDTLITINRQGHNGMTDHPEYLKNIRKILSN